MPAVQLEVKHGFRFRGFAGGWSYKPVSFNTGTDIAVGSWERAQCWRYFRWINMRWSDCKRMRTQWRSRAERYHGFWDVCLLLFWVNRTSRSAGSACCKPLHYDYQRYHVLYLTFDLSLVAISCWDLFGFAYLLAHTRAGCNSGSWLCCFFLLLLLVLRLWLPLRISGIAFDVINSRGWFSPSSILFVECSLLPKIRTNRPITTLKVVT